MAIDTAEKRKAVAGIPYFIFGPGVTNDATPGVAWRQESGWGYPGIAPEPPPPPTPTNLEKYMEILSAGSPVSLQPNVIYALPVVNVQLLASAVCQLSPTTTTTQFVDVAATTTGMQTSAGFIRCTASTTQVIVKRF